MMSEGARPAARARRSVLRSALGAFCVCAIAGCAGGELERPNAVLIVVDTLRADALSLAGYERETSPRLDAFARENLVFENAVSVAPVTPPAMAAILSGRLPYYEEDLIWYGQSAFGLHRFYASGKELGMPFAVDTLAERLRDAGYATGGFVANPYLKPRFQFDQGFDAYEAILEPVTPREHVLPYGPAEDLTRRGIEWLDEIANAPLPFFLYLHYMDPHHPYLPPPQHREALDFRRVPGKSDADVQTPWQRQARMGAPLRRRLAEHVRGLYDGEVRYVDHWIGVLLDDLAGRGLLDETLVVVTSDHGEEFLEHGGTGHKGRLYEEHLRVPLLMRVPGRGPARFSPTVRNFDLMPTLLDYCGVALPRGLDARSLRPLIEGEAEGRDRTVVASFPSHPDIERKPLRMIRTDHYKYVHALDPTQPGELYDLTRDPSEQENLFAEGSDRVASLRARLDAAFRKPARESREGFDLVAAYEAMLEAQEAKVKEALARLSPNERAGLIGGALSRLSPEELQRIHAEKLSERSGEPPADRPGRVDHQTAEQLRALGYAQ